MNNKILVLGGGVAGSSMAYYLGEKGYDVTVIERNSKVGGLARTCTYSGHPYEFGPHIWFWPGGKEDPVNATIVRLTNDELYHIDRRLFTFVEADRRKYRYPVHYQDIAEMPDKDKIEREVRHHRDEHLKLIEDQLPVLGQSKFADYFTAAIGETLYKKFMADYTWKMWNIPGDELETSMVWADRFHHAYTKPGEKSAAKGLSGYDPLKFEDHTLGKGIKFQVYPKHGWNAVWGAMVARSRVIRDSIVSIEDEHKQPFVRLASGDKHYFSDYHTVFCSIDIDELWGESRLPYTGRMMVPLLIPGLEHAFPEGAESLHYSSCEFQTRVTEMKVITRHESPDTLILIEVPILPGAAAVFPKNTIDYARENNLFAEKAYPQQSEQAFAIYDSYVARGKKIPNLRYVGRHSEFKYWGMPETVNSAYQKSLEFPGGLMTAGASPRVLTSTTSHKREPLLPTLEIFGRLGLRDVDLNLHHIIEIGETIAGVQRAVEVNGLRLWVLSGGWCDFYQRAPEIEQTLASVARQVALAEALGVDVLRLFFGRLHYQDYSPAVRATIVANLTRLSDLHPAIRFVFENHDGASLYPEVCAEVMERVARPNIRLNFDPINFAKAGVSPMAALDALRPYVGHVHLKGLERGEYCEFGEGDVDVAAIVSSLIDGGYRGRFTVEYEGRSDGTLRLYRSVNRARALLDPPS